MQGLLAVGVHQLVTFTEDKSVIAMPDLPAQAVGVLIQAMGADARYTLDGSDPATSGFILYDHAEPMLLGYIPSMSRITFAGQVGGSVAWQAVRRV